MNLIYSRRYVVDDVIRRLTDKNTYNLIFSKKVIPPKEKTEEDILCYWAKINPKLIDLIDEFELEL